MGMDNGGMGGGFATGAGGDLSQCPSCGRSFNENAYHRHVKVCKKVFVQKRKVFNAAAHRIDNPEQQQMV